MILLSILFLIAGLLTFPLPVPIGAPLLLLGLVLLVRHSPDAKRHLVRLSQRYPMLHRFLNKRKKPANATTEDRIE